jgi:hypothetical protein
MATISIKALALKALHGNRQGNQPETGSFHGGNSPAQVGDSGKPYTCIYSHLLKDSLLLVRTDAQAAALRRQGLLDVIYTAAEVQTLKGKTPNEIRAVHGIKKAFPSGTIHSTGERDSSNVK